MPPSLAARAPTYLEKVTIVDAFNQPGRAWPSRCVRIYVSTVDPRYAMATSPASPPKACVKTGAIGNGFILFKRTSKTALHWRDMYEGSEAPPCSLPQAVRHDLFRHTPTCTKG